MANVFAYLRLSREDLAAPGHTDEKLARQAASARELAARHGVTLPESHILIERESGRRLKNRPVLLRLLDLMHGGQCDTLITPFADRIARLEAAARRAIKRIEQVQNAQCNSFLKDVVLSLEQALT